jgi:putative transposase
LGISRSRCYRILKCAPAKRRKISRESDQELLRRIAAICQEHPFWGYRRVTAWLQHREEMPVNHKRVYRLMRENNLTVRQKRYSAKRVSNRPKPQPDRPHQWWGIDMTKFLVEEIGWVYLVVVLDWYTRKIVGYHLDLRSKTADWLQALDEAVNQQFPDGVREHHLHLMSDNGSQPTSVAFMKACRTLQIKQAFTSYNNPKGNANTERVMRTLKEECIWIAEWHSLDQVQQDIARCIEGYNTLYPHSMLNYLSPVEFENQCASNSTQKAA